MYYQYPIYYDILHNCMYYMYSMYYQYPIYYDILHNCNIHYIHWYITCTVCIINIPFILHMIVIYITYTGILHVIYMYVIYSCMYMLHDMNYIVHVLL